MPTAESIARLQDRADRRAGRPPGHQLRLAEKRQSALEQAAAEAAAKAAQQAAEQAAAGGRGGGRAGRAAGRRAGRRRRPPRRRRSRPPGGRQAAPTKAPAADRRRTRRRRPRRRRRPPPRRRPRRRRRRRPRPRPRTRHAHRRPARPRPRPDPGPDDHARTRARRRAGDRRGRGHRVRDRPDRRPLQVGRRGPRRLGLLGPDRGRLGQGRQVPAALLGRAVHRLHAASPRPSWPPATWCSGVEQQPELDLPRGPLRGRRPDDPRPRTGRPVVQESIYSWTAPNFFARP